MGHLKEFNTKDLIIPFEVLLVRIRIVDVVVTEKSICRKLAPFDYFRIHIVYTERQIVEIERDILIVEKLLQYLVGIALSPGNDE